MSRVRCLVPITVRVAGRLGPAELAALAAAIDSAVAGRLAVAAERIAARGDSHGPDGRPRRPRCHLPAAIAVHGGGDGGDRAALEAAIRDGLARGLARATASGSLTPGLARSERSLAAAGPADRERPREPLAASGGRAGRAAGPGDGGGSAGKPQERRPPDHLQTADAPLVGLQLARSPDGVEIRVAAPRAAVVADLERALIWGDRFFAGSSFAVLEGPGSFWVVATDPPVASPAQPLSPAGAAVGAPAADSPGESAPWELAVVGGDDTYRLLALVTADGTVLLPPQESTEGEPWRDAAGPWQGAAALPAAARGALPPDDTEEWLVPPSEAGETGDVGGTDDSDYALLEWELKEICLKILLAGWLGEEERAALAAILRSLTDGELAVALALLRESGRLADLRGDDEGGEDKGRDELLALLLAVAAENPGAAEDALREESPPAQVQETAAATEAADCPAQPGRDDLPDGGPDPAPSS